MEQVESNGTGGDSKKFNFTIYGLGVAFLAVFLIVGLESVGKGLLVLLAYIQLYVFLRYLQRQGGMG